MQIFLFYFCGIEYRFVKVDMFKFDCSENLEKKIPLGGS